MATHEISKKIKLEPGLSANDVPQELDSRPTDQREMKLDPDYLQDSCSGDAWSSASSENTTTPIITKGMEDEENKMAAEAAEEEERMRKEYEKRLDDEEREVKQKRLFHLLSRSQFYTNFLVQKIEKTQEEERKKKEMMKKRQEKQAEMKKQQGNVAKTETNALKEIKISNSPTQVKVNRKKKVAKEKITDYIDKQAIENVKYQKSENDDDIFGVTKNDMKLTETKLTSLGIEVPVSQPSLFEGGVLRDYQVAGLEWMKTLYENGVNGILADEMGLGKTIQVIALICYMIENNVTGPFLIIAPLSTLPNWIMEFQKLAPQVPVVLFHGSKHVRPTLYPKLTKKVKVLDKWIAPIIVTSYQMPKMEYAILSRMRWKYLIVDEGHVLKNVNASLPKCLRTMHSANRLLLTGTPLQNNLTELWALLNFLLPDVFDDLQVFSDLFQMDDIENSILDQEEKHKVLSTLHQILTPFLLRRLKADVEINLPPKKELLVYCPMTPIQLDMYRTTVDRTIVEMLKPKKALDITLNPDGSRPKRRCAQKKRDYARGLESDDEDETFESSLRDDSKTFEVVDRSDPAYVSKLTMVNPAMQLRKIVNHPYLVHMPVNPDKTLRVDEELVNKSGKMLVIDALLTKLKERGHKVLVFSFFKILLDLLEEVLYMRDYKFVRLDGGCDFETRKEAIRSFNTDPDVFAFLITTRAGGLGLNLTAADTVVIFDSDWNPQADLQAMDRCHRIGQLKPIVVYRLVTKGTIDEHIIDVAARKRKLEKIIIKKGKFKLSNLNMKKIEDLSELEELKQLLESTDHHKVIHSNGFVFSDKELDELLDRSDMTKNDEADKRPTTENKVFKVIKTAN